MVEVANERGYAATRVSDLPDPTGISRLGLEAALRRMLEYFGARPNHARFVFTEVLCIGPSGTERHEATMAMLASRLTACARWQPGRCDSLERDEVAQAVIGAIVRVIELRLNRGDGGTLPSRLPSLTALTAWVGLAA